MSNAIGMIELSSIARGIETCDFMLKAAQVDLIRSSTVCPGKYIVTVQSWYRAVLFFILTKNL
jgi:microcompartment protein CcmL/EutN